MTDWLLLFAWFVIYCCYSYLLGLVVAYERLSSLCCHDIFIITLHTQKNFRRSKLSPVSERKEKHILCVKRSVMVMCETKQKKYDYCKYRKSFGSFFILFVISSMKNYTLQSLLNGSSKKGTMSYAHEKGNGTFVCLRPLICYWVKKNHWKVERKKNKKENNIESDWKVFACQTNVCS